MNSMDHKSAAPATDLRVELGIKNILIGLAYDVVGRKGGNAFMDKVDKAAKEIQKLIEARP